MHTSGIGSTLKQKCSHFDNFLNSKTQQIRLERVASLKIMISNP